ncbi:MAG: patatin-like phospholipase family protein [Saprospiraceae bacterium]|nr:patatin-like phospholipase family protein [Saprospiraceae bacterium]
MKQYFEQLFYSFPLQLLLSHVRSNVLLIGMWLLVALLITGKIGNKLGIPYLFLDPEYQGSIDFFSFFLVGLAYGGFVMSWNLTTYLLNSHHFPFLASLSRPFTKFCINNSLLPLVFFILYSGYIFHFQLVYESVPIWGAFLRWLGLCSGGLAILIFYSAYFHLTNKDISYYEIEPTTPQETERLFVPGRRDVDMDYIKQDENRWKVMTYLNESFRPKLVRSVAHYDVRLLLNIFRQNHLNVLLLQLLTMGLLLALGYLIDAAAFRIPAAASIFILLSIFTAIIGAIIYWFSHWWFTVFLGLLFVANYVTSFDELHQRNKAYGMDYGCEPAEYSLARMQEVCESGQIELDKKNTTDILNTWLSKVSAQRERPGKPKMVLFCVSGGGLRSAIWTMKVIQTADSLMDGQLMPHSVLITGASGGMIGASYLRELYLQKQNGKALNVYDHSHIDQISKDLLNSIAFTIVTNDIFLPWARFQQSGHTYNKDRGYIFERQLNENTHGLLDKSLSDYRDPERRALIPMLYLTPTIVNDGRRLVVSPHGASFMMIPPVSAAHRQTLEVDAVDYGWMFGAQSADSLRFLTALRMNATYPYILPNVHLPSIPSIEVMDAGALDNYGLFSAIRFVQVFRDWIEKNTSGVVLVQINTSERTKEISASNNIGVIESLFNPVGIAGKVFTLQEFQYDNSLGLMYNLLGKDRMEVIRFVYRPRDRKKLKAAISFHITKLEKDDVLNAMWLPENRKNLEALHRAILQ